MALHDGSIRWRHGLIALFAGAALCCAGVVHAALATCRVQIVSYA